MNAVLMRVKALWSGDVWLRATFKYWENCRDAISIMCARRHSHFIEEGSRERDDILILRQCIWWAVQGPNAATDWSSL